MMEKVSTFAFRERGLQSQNGKLGFYVFS